MRIEALIPWFEHGKIYITKEMQELVDEYLSFPVGEHDDLLDTLAYQLQVMSAGKEYEKKPASDGMTVKKLFDNIKKLNRIRGRNPNMESLQEIKAWSRICERN